jgi:hypothetical protein
MLSTFAFVTVAWVFFRAESIGDAMGYLSGCLNHFEFQGKWNWVMLGFLFVLLIIDWSVRNNDRNVLAFKPSLIRRLIYVVLILSIFAKFQFQGKSTFIYFQF